MAQTLVWEEDPDYIQGSVHSHIFLEHTVSSGWQGKIELGSFWSQEIVLYLLKNVDTKEIWARNGTTG